MEDRNRHGRSGWSCADRELTLSVALLGMMLQQVQVELPVSLEPLATLVRTIKGGVRLNLAQPERIGLAGGVPDRHFDQNCHSVPQSAGREVHPTEHIFQR